MKKHTLLSMGTLLAIATPLTTVIACGSADDSSAKEIEEKAKEIISKYTRTNEDESIFLELEIEGTMTLEEAWDDLKIKSVNNELISKEDIEKQLTEIGSSLKNIKVSKYENSLNVNYNMSHIADFSVMFTHFKPVVITDAQKIAAVKKEIDSLEIGTELTENNFKTEVVNPIDLESGLPNRNDQLGLLIPAVDFNGATVKMSKIVDSTTLTFEIKLGEEVTIATSNVELFEIPTVTEQEKVDAVLQEIDNITFQSSLDLTNLQNVVIDTPQVWDGHASVMPNILATPSVGISDMLETTIAYVKPIGTLEIMFTVTSSDNVTNGRITKTLLEKPADTNTDQEDVTLVKNSIDAMIIPDSNLDQASIEAVGYSKTSWGGEEIDDSMLGTIIPPISELHGTTIDIVQNGLSLEFTISKGSANNEIVSKVLTPFVASTPTEQERADVIVQEIETMIFTSNMDDSTIGVNGPLTNISWDGNSTTDLHSDLETFSDKSITDVTDATINFDYDDTTHKLIFNVVVGAASATTTSEITIVLATP